MGNADITVSSFLQTVKIQWPQARLNRRLLDENPAIAMIPIKPFSGRTVYLVAQYSGQQGRSADFGKALANRAASQQVAFILTSVHDYATGGVDGETLEAIEDDESLIDGINSEMDSSFYSMQRSLAVHVFGDGTGAIGRVGTDDSATQFTLLNKYDAVNFMNGQILVANPTKTGSSATIIAGSGRVVSVNETTGQITYEALGGWNPSANDWLYIDGDYDAKMKGLQAWLPATDPTGGDSFFSVDRSVHPTRLAGYRFDGSAFLPEEAIEKALAHAGTFGCRPDLIVVNPMDYYAMKRSLGNRAIIDLAKSPNDVNVGFEALTFVNRNKKARVIEDHGCPKGTAFALDSKKVAIYARKKAVVRLLNKDGQELRADANADAYIWRLGGYFQMGMEDPGAHLRITLPTT